MNLLKCSGAGAAILLLAVAVLSLYGRWRWDGLTEQLVARLEAARMTPRPAHFDARELEGLPQPVQRYLRAALTEGMPLVAAAVIEHTGTFSTSEKSDRWKPFTSTQRVVMRRPGFVWDGRIVIMPGLRAHVHDAYVAGEGILHPTIAGVVSLANLRGGGDLARAELMRFLAESAWYPTALLPSQGVRWETDEGAAARATLTDGALSVTLLFRFGSDGMIESVRAETRGRTVNGRIIMTPWEGCWADYTVRDGMRVPSGGEVAWLTPEGRKPYWRGSIARVRYEWAGAAAPE